jgi:hypothetical protein
MDHGGTWPADGIHRVPDEDDTVVNPVVPAARPGQDSAQSDSVRSRGGAHRRVDEDEGTASRGRRPSGRAAYLLAAAAALVVALLAAAVLTIAHMVAPVTVADPYGPTATSAPAPDDEAADRFGLATSATPGASNTASRSATPGPRSPTASPAATRASASASPPTRSPSGAASPVWTTLTVTATKALFRGDSVQTNRTRLIMKPDGNLAIIDEKGVTRWTSGTAGSGSQATFQADGNFVVYDANARPLWSSRTDRHNGAVLMLRANGDVCVIDDGTPLWCAGTAH